MSQATLLAALLRETPSEMGAAARRTLAETLMPSPNKEGSRAIVGSPMELIEANAARVSSEKGNVGSPMEWAMALAGGPRLGRIPKPRAELPMDEASRTGRAAEQGYTIDAYKGMIPYRQETLPDRNWRGEIVGGTEARVPQEITQAEGGRFYSSSPSVASRFAEVLGGPMDGRNIGAAVFPVKLKFENPKIIDAKGEFAADFQFGPGAGQLKLPKDSPHDGVILKNTKDEGDVYIPRESSQIRSRFAAFDPSQKDSAGLLATLAALLAVPALKQQENE